MALSPTNKYADKAAGLLRSRVPHGAAVAAPRTGVAPRRPAPRPPRISIPDLPPGRKPPMRPPAPRRPVAPPAYVPLTPDELAAQARANVYGPYNSIIDATVQGLLGKAAYQSEAERQQTSRLMAALAPYANRIRGIFNPAAAGAEATGQGIGSTLAAQGGQLAGELGGKLAGIRAPGQAVDLYAGGASRVGQAAGATVGALGSAESARLHGVGEANAGYAEAQPGIAQLESLARLGLIRQDLAGNLEGQIGKLQIEAERAYMDEVARLEKLGYDREQAAALAKYRNAQLAVSRQRAAASARQANARIAESKRYHDIQAELAGGRLDVSRYGAVTSRMNTQTSQARLNESAAQHAAQNAQAWARIATGQQNAGISASRNQLAWEKFKANPNGDGSDGGYTKHDVLKLQQLAGQVASQSFKGYWALLDDPDTPLTQSQLLSMMKAQGVGSPAELDGVGQATRSYQEAMSMLLDAHVPLVMAQKALNRYWTEPGDPRPGYTGKQEGRPKQSFQERNPGASGKAGAAAETAANRWGGTTDPGGPLQSSGNRTMDKVLAAAQSQIGVPYVWGAESPKQGFDCSGLIDWAYRQAGIDFPGRMTTRTALQLGRSVKGQTLRPGDMLITNGGEHMVMYVGNGRVIAAPHKGEVVQYQPVARFAGDIVDVRRVV